MDWYRIQRELALPALLAVLLSSLHAGSALAQQPVLRQSQVTPPFADDATGDSAAQMPAADGATAPTDAASEPQENAIADFGRTTIVDGAAGGSVDSSDTSATDLGPADTLRQLDPDIRLTKDRDAFEKPAAGYDPKYFQIEQLDPLLNRRTREFFEADPFEHVGWRLGSFILFQELEISPAWDSNVFFSRNARSDWNAGFRSETRFVSNWANHAIEFRMLQDRNFHREFTTQNQAGQAYELRGRLDITSRTTAEAALAREVAQESPNSIDARGTITGARPDVTTDRINLSINHSFNRLSLQLRGRQADTSYEQNMAGAPRDRDVTAHTLAFRAQWEFRPTFSIFGEIEHDRRDHPEAAATDGLSRNSAGERYRAGVALGQTGEFLRGEASIGYGVQRPDAAPLKDVEAFLVDANVAWRITPLTSILFEARTGFNETTLTGSAGVVDRRIGARIRHSFTPRLTAEAGISYGTQNYAGRDLSERNVTLSSGVDYSLNRHVALFGRVEHIRFRSSEEARDYDASTVRFGVRLRN